MHASQVVFNHQPEMTMKVNELAVFSTHYKVLAILTQQFTQT
jgi:hypothetical protein